MEDRSRPGFTLLGALIIALFWIVGFVLLMLQQFLQLHIEGWLIGLFFWGPYALFILIFIIALLRSILSRGNGEEKIQ